VDRVHRCDELNGSPFVAYSQAKPSIHHLRLLLLKLLCNFPSAGRHIQVRDISILNTKLPHPTARSRRSR
jgi:hypothetical protein